MAEDVVIRYRAEVDDLTKKLELIADEQKEIINLEKQSEAQAKKNISAQEFAAKKRLEILKKEEQALLVLKKQRSLAFDPKQISDFNKAIQESERRIKNLKGASEKELGGISGAIKSFASGAVVALGAAFSVGAITQFANASVDAFLDAEKNAERLKFAITTIGGESEAVFDKLIEQSSELQKITIFSDDSIQNAQAALAAFGLTGREIEELLPKLADFATVSGIGIEQAAEQIGAGLEGAGREFKKYGIEVSATATRQQNLNNILSGFNQFAGAATNATKTLSGQLQQAANQADELQESIGEKLAPAFVKVRLAFLNFVDSFVDGFKTINKLKIEGLEGRADDRIEATAAEVEGIFDSLVKNGVSELEALDKAIKIVEERLTGDFNKIVGISTQAASDERFLLKQELESLVDLREDFNKRITENERRAAEERLKKAKELAEQKKASDERDQSLDFETKAIETLAAEYKDLFAVITDTDFFTGEALDKKRLLELDISSDDIEEFRKKVIELATQNPIEVPVELTIPQDREPTDMVGLPPIEEVENHYDEIISLTTQLVGELSTLFGTIAQNEINAIERVRDSRLDAIDNQRTATDEALEKRRISATEAERIEKRLLDEQVKAEAEADKKIREIKRKQAIADKAAALISITINTAKAVAEAAGQTGVGAIALAPLLAALGAAQAAIVLAQPIPYAKGTKSAKQGLARVGEQGEEIMYVPGGTKVLPNKQTNRYAEVLDAMFDNRFDDFVLNRYVNPALMKQKQKSEAQRSDSFAENVGKSIVYNQISAKNDPALKQALKNGMPITNADAVGEAVARHLKRDIYR